MSAGAPPQRRDSVTDDFPVTWEGPADAELSWGWDDMHYPRPLPPLSGDYVRYAVAYGSNYRLQRAALPVRNGCRVIRGYA
jgi:hypothetical protein